VRKLRNVTGTNSHACSPVRIVTGCIWLVKGDTGGTGQKWQTKAAEAYENALQVRREVQRSDPSLRDPFSYKENRMTWSVLFLRCVLVALVGVLGYRLGKKHATLSNEEIREETKKKLGEIANQSQLSTSQYRAFVEWCATTKAPFLVANDTVEHAKVLMHMICETAGKYKNIHVAMSYDEHELFKDVFQRYAEPDLEVLADEKRTFRILIMGDKFPGETIKGATYQHWEDMREVPSMTFNENGGLRWGTRQGGYQAIGRFCVASREFHQIQLIFERAWAVAEARNGDI
jgi:hypothetical protein